MTFVDLTREKLGHRGLFAEAGSWEKQLAALTRSSESLPGECDLAFLEPHGSVNFGRSPLLSPCLLSPGYVCRGLFGLLGPRGPFPTPSLGGIAEESLGRASRLESRAAEHHSSLKVHFWGLGRKRRRLTSGVGSGSWTLRTQRHEEGL